MKKTTAALLAAMVATGFSAMAFASEDVPSPVENQARMETRSEPQDNFSVRDYQEMNDDLGVATEKEGAGPAFGARYGEVYVELPDDVREEEAFDITRAASVATETPVPKTEANTAQGTQAAQGGLPGSEEVANNAVPQAAGETAAEKLNPNTGAADMAFPLLSGIIALAAVPFMRKKK